MVKLGPGDIQAHVPGAGDGGKGQDASLQHTALPALPDGLPQAWAVDKGVQLVQVHVGDAEHQGGDHPLPLVRRLRLPAQRLDQGGVSGGVDQVFSGEGDLLIRPPGRDLTPLLSLSGRGQLRLIEQGDPRLHGQLLQQKLEPLRVIAEAVDLHLFVGGHWDCEVVGRMSAPDQAVKDLPLDPPVEGRPLKARRVHLGQTGAGGQAAQAGPPLHHGHLQPLPGRGDGAEGPGCAASHHDQIKLCLLLHVLPSFFCCLASF